MFPLNSFVCVVSFGLTCGGTVFVLYIQIVFDVVFVSCYLNTDIHGPKRSTPADFISP